MRARQLILRSLAHYRRTHLGVAAGAVVASAVLVGALMVGDSVRHGLERQALRRIGGVQLAMHTGDRPFTDELAERLTTELSSAAEPAAAGLRLDAVAIADGGRRRAPEVRVYGIDPAFWALGDVAPQGPSDRGVVINRALANALAVAVGDDLLFRFAEPSALPRDVPLGSDAEGTVTLRGEIETILEGGSFGDFDLAMNQLAPLNAFVDRRRLQRATGLEGRSNLVLATTSAARPAHDAPAAGDPRAAPIVPAALAALWRVEDASARLRRVGPEGPWDLSSERVFLDDALVDAARAAAPSRSVSTYFVNAIEAPNGRVTRYAMVAAMDPAAQPGAPASPVPPSLALGEIVVTEWTAAELAITVGDEVTLRYWTFGLNRQLAPAAQRFTVAAVVATEAPGGDRLLMPELPGLTDVASALDWSPAPELDVRHERITAAEKEYWDVHRGAPKAFVSLEWARGEGAWRTPYGHVTAVRLAAHESEDALRAAIRERIGDASRLGLGFVPLREIALRASREGVASYFGGLFLALGAFVLVAAATLTALLFSFNVEQRSDQIGTLSALGFRPRRIARLMLGEGLVVAAFGALLGVPAGWLYASRLLAALSGNWAGAVADAALAFHVAPRTPVIGFAVTLTIAAAAMAWVLRRQLRREAHELMSARFGWVAGSRLTRRRALVGVCAGLVVAGGLAVAGLGADAGAATGLFFGAGVVLLVTAVLCAAGVLRPPAGGASAHLTFAGLGRRNGGRRLGRSLATVSMLASGVFLIVAVNAFRPPADRVTGTGGFEMFATTSLPVVHDLESPSGAERLGVGRGDVRFLAMRLRGGDEASCRNLHAPQKPPLLGVATSAIAARDPFRFRRTLAGAGSALPPWTLLERPDEPDVVAGIVDDAVAQWVLRVGLGDTIEYVDDAGRPFRVRVVGTLESSILQGYVLIDERAFARRFPSMSGRRVFLVDFPPEEYAAVERELAESALGDHGLTAVPAAERLAAFDAVQNTYLSIFSTLGGFGLILGCAGLALVVLRNVLERRAELGLLRAVGFSHGRVRRLVLIEHWGLLALGAGSGVVAALVAVGPALLDRGRLPVALLAWIVAAVVANGLLCTAIATAIALRGDLVTALRSE